VFKLRPAGKDPLISEYLILVPVEITDKDVETDSVTVLKNPEGVIQIGDDINVFIELLPHFMIGYL
jgi:hypothetical protein